MSAAVERYHYSSYLHDPHSTLDIDHPDSEVFVIVTAEIMTYEEELPVVQIRNIKVYPDLESEDWDDPTQDQLDFWDLSNRILEEYLWGQQECLNCNHKLSLHLEQEADFFGCCETDCDCAGEKADLEP